MACRCCAHSPKMARSFLQTATWQFPANSSPGRWLLHCHNEIHMIGGMMAEVVYIA